MRVNLQARETQARCRKYPDNKRIPSNPFITRDGFQFYKVSVSAKVRYREMSVCHEMAHVLLCRKTYGRDRGPMANLREEILAWRLGKSFCRPEYWNETDAIENIASYLMGLPDWKQLWRKINWKLFRIVPLKHGISIKS